VLAAVKCNLQGSQIGKINPSRTVVSGNLGKARTCARESNEARVAMARRGRVA